MSYWRRKRSGLFEETNKNNQLVYYVDKRKELVKVSTLSKTNIEKEYSTLFKDTEFYRTPVTLFETDTSFTISYSAYSDKESKGIKPGVYQAKNSIARGIELMQLVDVPEDNYVDLSGTFTEIEKELSDFFNRKEDYRALGLAHRRSILMWGEGGNGKTTIIKKLINKYRNNTVIVYLPDRLNYDLINVLKTITYNKIFIFEEITENSKADMGNLLKFLDGELSINNSFTLATTNYPEQLPGNIVDRPSRIDKLVHMKCPNETQRKVYLEELLKRSVTEDEIKLTKDFTIAYLKEISLTSLFNKQSILEVIKNTNSRKKLVEKAFAPPKAAMGFSMDDLD